MKYEHFYKLHGVTKYSLTNDKAAVITSTTKPATDTVGHWLDFGESIGPSEHHIFTRTYPTKVLGIEDLESRMGKPRAVKYVMSKELKQYVRKIPGVTVLTNDIASVNTRNRNLFITYHALWMNTRYVGIGGDYFKAYNIIATMLYYCNEVADINLVNMIHIPLPTRQPDTSWYKRVSKLAGSQLYKEVDEPALVFLVELHKWFQEIPSVFDLLDERTIESMNVLWQTPMGPMLVNIGALRLTNMEDVEVERDSGGTYSTITTDQLLNFTSRIGAFNINYGKDTESDRDDDDDEPLTMEESIEATMEVIHPSDPDKADEVAEEDKQKLISQDPTDSLQKRTIERLKDGTITPNKRTIVNKAISRASAVLNATPIAEGELKFEQTDVQLQNPVEVIDKTMLKSTSAAFDTKYLKTILDRDIIASFAKFAHAGIIINQKDSKVHGDVTGDRRITTIEVQPIDGDRSTLKVMLPVFSDDNTYTSDGTVYRMKKQMGELPIRKVDNDQVTLNSYYGKLFVQRSRMAVDSDVHFLNKILSKLSMGKEATITVTRLNIFDQSLHIPMIYGKLMMVCSLLVTSLYKFDFTYKEREDKFVKKGDSLKTIEKDGFLVGITKTGKKYITVRDDNKFYIEGESIGSIYDILGILPGRVPVALAVCKVLGKQISFGIIMSYWFGLSSLLRVLKVKLSVLGPRQRPLSDLPAIMVIQFKDVKVMIHEGSDKALMILQGLVKNSKILKNLTYKEMDKKGTYGHILTEQGFQVRFLRELELIHDLFIDPMTKRRLKAMKEPTEIKMLCLRAVELLTDTYSPRGYDGKLMAIKGYERIAGAIYGELVQSTRGYKNQYNSKRKALEMSPFATWQAIIQDPSVKSIESTNPVQYLKEQDAVTLGGTGGRGSRTLTIQSRRFDPNSLGIISEASLDNGDVGGSSYLSVNSRMDDVMGFNKSELETTSDNPTASYSTTYMINPFSDRDDPKRNSFAAIQSTHIVSAEGYEIPYVQTGYESVIPHRVGKLYSTMAKDEGVVVSKNKDAITVKYKDGTKVGINLGNVYGKAEGSYYPHNIITELKKGDKVKKGSPIAFNKAFFRKNSITGNLTYVQSVMCRVALIESEHTLEDSTVITTEFAKKLYTNIGKVRDVTIDATTRVKNMVKVGQEVEIGEHLMALEQSAIADNDTIQRDEAKSALMKLTDVSPRSEYKGLIDKIEIYYNCELSDMSNSIRELAKVSNDQIARISAADDRAHIVNGKVGDNFKIQGRPLQRGEVVMRIYYVLHKTVVTGDKVVFCNQLKCTIGEVMTKKLYDARTKTPIGAYFSMIAIGARIVISPFYVGFLSSYLKEVPNHLMELYKK